MNKRHSPADKLLMAEVSEKFEAVRKRKGWNAKRAAAELGVCTASYYNYINQTDVPRWEVLKWAHEKWRLEFTYIDFERDRVPPFARNKRRKQIREVQYVLPFLEKLQQKNVHVLRITPKRPNRVRVELEIEFAV